MKQYAGQGGGHSGEDEYVTWTIQECSHPPCSQKAIEYYMTALINDVVDAQKIINKLDLN